MTDPRTYALNTVTEALALELPQADRAELRQRAESFIAIAERGRVPIEELLHWIHLRAPEKEWSLAEWRGWCALYVQLRERYGSQPPQQALFPDAHDAGAFDPK